MNTRPEFGANDGFLSGLIAGGVIGAGFARAFAPRVASEIRQRVRALATELRHAAFDTGHTTNNRARGKR